MPRPRKRRSWGAWSIDYIEARRRWRVRAPASVDPKRAARYFKERAQAEAWVKAEQRRLATATHHELGTDVTVGEWLGHWYATTADAADWSASTRLVYREQLWYWSRAYATKLRELRTSQLNTIVGLLRTVGPERRPEITGKPPPKDPRPLSNRTIRAACATLERAIEAARDDGLIDRNPAANMIRPRVVTVKPTIWTLKERRLVYAELAKEDLYPAFLIEVENGLRVGEVLALKWNDIDFERRVILVRRTVHRSRIQEWPKNRKPREVPMGRYSLRVLVLHRDRGILTGPQPDGWVFQRADGNPVAYNRIRYRLQVACKRAGVTYRPTHTARHLHSTLLQAAGIPAADVAERLGHSNLSTLGTYSHAQVENQQRIVDAASAIVEAFLAPIPEIRVQNGDLSADPDGMTRDLETDI